MELVQAGGMPVLALVACALVSNPLAIAAIVVAVMSKTRQRAVTVGGISLALGVGAIALGMAGYFYSMSQVEAALAFAEPSMREELNAMGESEARIGVWVALASSALPLLAGVVAVGRGLMLPATREPGGR
jgi:hypothetical protein